MVLVVVIGGSIFTIALFVVWLSQATNGKRRALDRSALVVFVTILLSWAFIHTIFALHYAHEFYAEASWARRRAEFSQR